MNATLRILLIDDNPDDRLLVSRELRREFPDFQVQQVIHAEDFAQALAKGGIDLVITDYQLGWNDGLTVLRTVKNRWPDCPVIMFTATGNEEVAVEAMKAGLDDYVVKSPKHLVRLPAAVRLVREKNRERRELKETQARYQSFLQHFPGIAFQGRMDYIPVFFQGAVEAITGYTEKDFVAGKPRWNQVIHPDDLSCRRYQETSEKLRSIPGSSLSREYRIIRKDGQIRWVHEIIQNICDDTGKPTLLHGTIYDITDRKQAAEALKKSERRYRAVVEDQTELICRFKPGEILTFVNDAYTKFFHQQKEALIGQSFMPLIYEEDREKVEKFFSQFNKINPIATHEHRVLLPDGEIRWQQWTNRALFDESGNIIEFQAVGRDITELKQAVEALKKNARRMAALNTLGRQVSAGLSLDQVVMAALKGVVTVLGPDLAMIFLKREDQLVLQEVLSAHPDQCWDEPALLIGECLCGLAAWQKEPLYSADITRDPRCTLESCKKTGIRSFAALPLVGGGTILGLLGLAWTMEHDFEEQTGFLETVASTVSIGLQNALLYDQVQRHANQLEQRVAERTAELQSVNAELKAFAYTVSHDLRAPLRAMQGFADALLEDYADQMDSVAQDYAHRIVAASRRLDEMIHDLLTYSRLTQTAKPLRSVNLAHILRKILLELEGEIRKEEAEIIIEEPLPSVLANYVILAQVLANLVTNAVKFVAPGVRPKVRIRAEERDGRVRLWVEDNGIGIASEHQERIFQVFERLHGIETFPGTGIGLAIVRKGVESMDGRVGVESAPGQGSKFWLELPSGPGNEVNA